MTKFDIKLRRGGISKGQIARHKDFRSLRNFQETKTRKGNLYRIILIIVALFLLIGMTIFGVLKVNDQEPVEHDDGMEVFEEFKQ